MNAQTASANFKAAHATAKATRANFTTYRSAFVTALKAVYAAAKVPVASVASPGQKLMAMVSSGFEGYTFKIWEKEGKKRIYVSKPYDEAGYIDNNGTASATRPGRVDLLKAIVTACGFVAAQGKGNHFTFSA